MQIGHVEDVSGCDRIGTKSVIGATGAEFVEEFKVKLLGVIQSWPIS